MQVVNRVSFPKSADVANLYLQLSGASLNYSDAPEIVFEKGGKLSTNSYFNSLYENFYTKYTVLDSLFYQLRLEGEFQVSIYRELYEQKDRELISSQKLDCQGEINVSLPKLTAGRVYFELECLSDRGIFKEGLIVTDRSPNKEVSLAVISCTYKKEEYIKKTVNTIVRDPLLQTKSWKIFVVDNGETLTNTDFPDSRVQLIPNRNVGGSGGFTRGLVEALQSDEYTHILFMDDDIELDSESIYRLFALYEYAASDFAVAGSMLDLIKKHVLYEAGALYGKDSRTLEEAPFSVALRKHNLELQNTESLNQLLLDEEIDYGGFWFFAFPRKVVEEIGLPLPYFIKVDDMEFCIRITRRLGGKIVAFPSIGVWHEPFYNKVIVWDSYYYARNNLITHSVYGTSSYINTIFKFTKDLVHALLIFEYNYAALTVKAFEDYLTGPSVIKTNTPEVLHKEILALTKSYKSQSIQSNYTPTGQVYPTKDRANFGKKLVSLLTLNGHLLPFLNSDGEVFLWETSDHSGLRSRAFGKKKVLIYREDNSCLFQNEFDKLVGIRILTRWIKAVASSIFKWSKGIAAWKAAYGEFTTTKFWHQYLGLKDRTSKVEAAQ